MKTLLTTMIIALTLFITGCASLNKDECLTADWYLIGFDDGANGKDVSRVGQHRQACAKHGVTPDIHQYENGYDNGIRKFCTPQKGYNKGKDGWKYQGICPQDLEFRFLEAYDDGYEIYELSQAIKDLQEEIKVIEDENEVLKKDMLSQENIIISKSSTAAQQSAALKAILKIQVAIDENKVLIDNILFDIHHLESDRSNKITVRDHHYY